MPKTPPWAPFLKPSHVNTYVAHESIKPGVEPNPTLTLITQPVATVASCSKLGPWLGESSHLRVYLKGHVSLPHFRNVNVFVDVTLGWSPLALSPTSFLWTNSGFSYFPIEKAHLYYVFVFLAHDVLPYLSFVFTQCAHLVSSSNPPDSAIFSCLWSPLQVQLKSIDLHTKLRLGTHQQIMLDWALQSKSPLPKQDMIAKFMHVKFNFSTERHAILFTCTTTPILPNWNLEVFYPSWTPSPFSLVATPLPFLAASTTMNLNLFTVDHACENP